MAVRQKTDRLQPDGSEDPLLPFLPATPPLPLEQTEDKIERVNPHLLPERGRSPGQLLQQATQFFRRMESRKAGIDQTTRRQRIPGCPLGKKSERLCRPQEALY
jgi:hypothetical protein